MKKIFVLTVGLLFCLMAGEGRAADGQYDALYPLGKQMTEIRDVAPSISDLNGVTICEVWNDLFQGEYTFELTRTMLKEKYPAINIVTYEEFGNPKYLPELAALPDKLKEFGCDAIIAGNGG